MRFYLIAPSYSLLVACALLGLPRVARSEDEPKTLRAEGVVQFARGSTFREQGERIRVPIGYLAEIHESDRLAVDEGAALKIATRSGCAVVLYGPSRALAPEGDRGWRFTGGAIRVACPSSETAFAFEFEGGSWTVKPKGEVLVDSTRALALQEPVARNGAPIRARQLYIARGATPLEPAPLSSAGYDFNDSHTPPRESVAWPRPAAPPRPRAPSRNRIALTPKFGSGRLIAENWDRGQEDLPADGGLLQYQREIGGRSLIIAVSMEGFGNRDSNGGNGQSPKSGISHNLETFSLEGGLRFSHKRWWSPYVRAGVQFSSDRVNVERQTDFNYSSNGDYKRYGLVATAGIDAQWSPSWLRWVGLYGGAEARAAQTVLDGGVFNFQRYGNPGGTVPPEDRARDGYTTTLAAMLFAGLFVQF